MANDCIECKQALEKEVYEYSLKNFGAPLCKKHQQWVRQVGTTAETIHLTKNP